MYSEDTKGILDDGNLSSLTNEGAHYGASSNMCFTVNSADSYQVSFGGASNSGAKIKIYNYDTNANVATIDVPVSTSEMPTLYTNISLSSGKYYVKVVSTSYSTYSSSSFSVYNISSIFYK